MNFFLTILLGFFCLFLKNSQIIVFSNCSINNIEPLSHKSFFLPIVLILALLVFSLLSTIFVDKIYKNYYSYYLINVVNNLSKVSIIFALLLSIAYFIVFFDNFFVGEEAHLVLLPLLILTFIFIFYEDFTRLVPILVKNRLKLAFTLLALSFLNSFVLEFEIGIYLQNLLTTSTIEEPNFEIACYGAVLYFLKGFFNLSFGEQLSISVVLLLFVEKLILIPEIAQMLILSMSSEENPELAQSNINPLPIIKPLVEKILPINNSVDILSQRTALAIKRESILCPWNVQFEKGMIEGLEKDYKILNKENGKYKIKNYAFSSLLEYDNKTKEVFCIKKGVLNQWTAEKVQEINDLFSKIEFEIGEDAMKKLFLQYCVLRNNKSAADVCQLLGLNPEENLRDVLLPKTRAFVGLNIARQGLIENVLKISITKHDTAKGLGTLKGPGYAESFPEDSSCAHTVHKLLQTIHPSGALVEGGVEGKGDFVIEEGGKQYFYEQKDLSIHKINNEGGFNANFQDRLLRDIKKTSGILIYKAPFLTEEDTPIVIDNLQKLATFSRRTILFFFQEQIIPINPKIIK